MATSQDFVNWICSGDLDPDFLKYLLISEGRNILRFASGAVHQTIYFPEAKAFHICCPGVPEQQRIVRILDQAFAGIEIAKVTAERNLENARALFESYLQTVFVQRKEGWPEMRLVDLCSFSSGGTPSKSQDRYWKGNIPWVSGRDMKSTQLSDAALHISQEALEKSATRIAPAGALLILVRGMGLAHGPQIAQLMAPCSFNQDIRAIHPSPNIVSRFLLFAVKTRINYSESIMSRAAHGTLKIDMDELRRVAVPVPSLRAQQKIADRIDELAVETQRLESLYTSKIAALDNLKKSLLHQAFSGAL